SSHPDHQRQPMTLALLGILLSLVVLITLAYRGHSVIAVAPFAASIAVLMSGAPLLASYTQVFMPALGGFMANFFPLFLAAALFAEADIPRRLMPAAIALAIFTFATAALPGSPQIHNTIPTKFFGTNTFAAPGLGILGAILVFGLGMLWLERRQRQLARAGESFAA